MTPLQEHWMLRTLSIEANSVEPSGEKSVGSSPTPRTKILVKN